MDLRVFLPIDHPWRSNKISFNGKIEFRHHNLDVMHIVKKIGYSILGTLLDISENRKDHAKARYDFKDMGIRKNFHPNDIEYSKRTKFAKAFF